MITGEQVKAARKLLGWSQTTLAARSDMPGQRPLNKSWRRARLNRSRQ